MSVIKSLLIISLFTILQNIDAQDTIEAVQFIDHPHKNEYILHQPGSDKHKYGYELKENKHFHHTTTEEDGVRLGCYGYSLNGKKYSTQYVADIKGYRPVYTYDVINVYPRSGGTREATFIGNFNEDQKKSENIRYFFPEGCRGDDSMIIIPPEDNPMTPIVIDKPKPTTPKTTPKPAVKVTPDIQIPIVTRPNVPTPQQKVYSTTPKPSPPPEKYLPPAKTYLPPTAAPPKGKYITKSVPPFKPQTPTPFKPITKATPAPVTKPPQTTTKPTVKPTPALKKPIVVAPIPEKPKNSCDANSCCNDDDALPKLVIPIRLDAGKSGSCARYAKLTVPADSVGMESLKTLLSNPTELAKTIIKSLS